MQTSECEWERDRQKQQSKHLTGLHCGAFTQVSPRNYNKHLLHNSNKNTHTRKQHTKTVQASPVWTMDGNSQSNHNPTHWPQWAILNELGLGGQAAMRVTGQKSQIGFCTNSSMFFTSTETIRLIRDGEPRTATSTSTQLLSSEKEHV